MAKANEEQIRKEDYDRVERDMNEIIWENAILKNKVERYEKALVEYAIRETEKKS